MYYVYFNHNCSSQQTINLQSKPMYTMPLLKSKQIRVVEELLTNITYLQKFTVYSDSEELKLDELEQYYRIQNLELVRVPFTENEDVTLSNYS